MKKLKKVLTVALATAVILTTIPINNVNADTKKEKSKVTYTLKKGTLTISGKGKMPKTMKFEKNKKIKKVVIKKGVTSVSESAFKDCKNLKKVSIPNTVTEIGRHSFQNTGIKKIVIPSSVKKIGIEALYGCDSLKKITMPGTFKVKRPQTDEDANGIMFGKKIESVTFNTKLNIQNVKYCDANNLYVSKKDNKYKSINGVIYSKDGKSIVRVPAKRKELVIEDGCTTFSLQSVLYALDVPDYGDVVVCSELKKIVIPDSVMTIDNTSYKANYWSTEDSIINQVVINSKNIDTQSIVTLLDNLEQVKVENIATQLPEKIKNVDGMYISDDGVLIKYTGHKSEVVVPSEVKEIAIRAFANDSFNEDDDKLEKVVLPEGIKKISEEAFSNRQKLTEINLPESIEYVGSRILNNCNVKKIVVPSNVKTWCEEAFYYSGVKEAALPDNMTYIPDGMFSVCDNLEKINIPEGVTTIGERAFACCRKLDINQIINSKNLKEIKENGLVGMDWTHLVIPAGIEKIGEGAFATWRIGKKAEKRKVIVEGSTKGIHQNAFVYHDYEEYESVTVKYKAKVKEWKTSVMVYSVSHPTKKKSQSTVEVYWTKVAGADGYQIKVSQDKKFKKNVTTVYAKKKKTFMNITVNSKKPANNVKIRPYKKVNGKKVYGKWTIDRI